MKKILVIVMHTLVVQLNGQLIIDESFRDVNFWNFKNQLEQVIVEKDTTELKKYLGERIHESNDGCEEMNRGCSREDFIQYYFGSGNSEEIWEEMLKIVRIGFYQIKSEDLSFPVIHEELIFKAPSYLKKVNTSEEVIILGRNVNIREKPSLRSKILKQASFEKYRCDCNILTMKETTYQTAEGIDWLEIYIDTNRIGYVAERYTSYSVIKEMHVGKVDGEWKIIWYYHPPGC